MNLLYAGYFCNEELFDRLVEAGSNGSHARQQLETKLLEGLALNLKPDEWEMISYLPYIESVADTVGTGEVYQGVNIRYLWCDKRKIVSLVRAFCENFSYIKEWAKRTDDKVVLTYATNPLHVIPLLMLRKRYQFQVVTLCSEVTIFRRKEKSSLISRISRKVSSFLDNSFDGYVLLSKYMNEVVNKKKRPYIVMEGVAKEPPQFDNLIKRKAVLYAGGLTEDNGIQILMDGFLQAEIDDLELWICGTGPMEEVVQSYAEQNAKIRYLGIVSNQQVQRLEQEAELLIAPRFSENEFTKYSFPSKTIEYMSTGTPTALTRLKGIPDEYFEYAYVLEEETSDGVEELLKEVFKSTSEDLEQIGKNAKKFVLDNKNSVIQALKVIDFLEGVCIKQRNS